eukprot:6582914-Lingulodinium_polyedra.AAC.1
MPRAFQGCQGLLFADAPRASPGHSDNLRGLFKVCRGGPRASRAFRHVRVFAGVTKRDPIACQRIAFPTRFPSSPRTVP